MSRATIPGLIVSAPRSGAGKTTVMLGLLRCLAEDGVKVRPYKCGPDYIDPAFHHAATGAPSVNLDSFAMAAPLLDGVAGIAMTGADLVIAEGSMGLFDGIVAHEGVTGANADIAARYGWPVILVLDVSGSAQSAAAVALGCAAYDPRIRIAGVVLNKVASARHRRLVEAGQEGQVLERLTVGQPSQAGSRERRSRNDGDAHGFRLRSRWRQRRSGSERSRPRRDPEALRQGLIRSARGDQRRDRRRQRHASSACEELP